MNVLSLFDGMSCGQQALDRLGIKVDNYFASEIDKHAIKVTMANYPGTIQLGSVVDVDVSKLPPIDILMGGSPCQSFSFAGKRKGMSTKDEQEILTLDHYLQLKSEGFEFEGQSYLFWEYMRILTEIRKYNPDVKFLLENVIMGEKWEKVLSRAIGVNPIEINSSLVSAQNRRRLYWTNIGLKPQGLFGDLQSIIDQPKDRGILLKDILESEVDEKYYLSEKMISGLLKSTEKHKEKGTGFLWQPTEGNKKAYCLRANAALCKTDNAVIVHNMQKRSPDRPALLKNKNAGGSGHLTRLDGKTYCLDTQNTNAVEIRDYGNKRLNEPIIYKENYAVIGNGYEQDNRAYYENGKSGTLDIKSSRTKTIVNSRIRRLTPTECERLQTVKDGYTAIVSDSQRYKMLGNGWTIEVITHILSYLNK
jgi:DNA (cytosine-5)-methyltransferase 3A